MGAKQTAAGKVQMDLTAEAPTVDEASELLDGAIKKLVEKVRKHGLSLASD
ncbi:hypothetical protein ES705_49616 [subsurface metagenome]